MPQVKGHKVSWGFDATGYVYTAVNVGAGAGKVFRDEAPAGQLNFKSIAAGAGIGVANNADDVTISNTAPENTSVANVGAGAGQVYRDMTGDQVNLKTIKAGANIVVTNNADDVEIAGAAVITRIPARIWVPAVSFRPNLNGANAPDIVWVDGSNVAFQALKFSRVDSPYGTNYTAVAAIKLPNGYDSAAGAKVRGIWYSDGADIINPVQWQVSTYSVAVGTPVDNGSWSGTPAHALGNGADNWGNVFAINGTLNAMADIYYLRIVRGYPFNTDINADTAYFVGAMITFSVDPTVF